MATYAIGDIQGCYDDLRRLLEHIDFDPQKDKLWFAGDLISRGPQSLESLRYVMSLGDCAISVLGNHDLHMLAVDAGVKKTKELGLQAILEAEDRRAMMDWLRKRPLLHHDATLGFTIVHAGIYPQWTLQEALAHAAELEAVLRSDNYHDFLQVMYGDKPKKWSAKHKGWDRLRFICNSFTRMRYCDKKGHLDMKDKGPPGTQQKSYLPWYAVPKRPTETDSIIFGHWSTLGREHTGNIYALDTGCVWGGQLTALRLDAEPPRYFSLDCPTHRKPPLP